MLHGMHGYIDTHIHGYTHIWIHWYTHTWIHWYTHTCMHVMHACMRYLHVSHTSIYPMYASMWLLSVNAIGHIDTHTHPRITHMHASHTSMYQSIHVCNASIHVIAIHQCDSIHSYIHHLSIFRVLRLIDPSIYYPTHCIYICRFCTCISLYCSIALSLCAVIALSNRYYLISSISLYRPIPLCSDTHTSMHHTAYPSM